MLLEAGLTLHGLIEANNDDLTPVIESSDGLKSVSWEGWSWISWAAKCDLVEQLVEFSAQLFRTQCNSTGNIYVSNDAVSSPDPQYSDSKELPVGHIVGCMVSVPLFWHRHLSVNIPRGSFRTSIEWLPSWLTLTKYDIDNPRLPEEDESDSDFDSNMGQEQEMILNVTSSLLEKIP